MPAEAQLPSVVTRRSQDCFVANCGSCAIAAALIATGTHVAVIAACAAVAVAPTAAAAMNSLPSRIIILLRILPTGLTPRWQRSDRLFCIPHSLTYSRRAENR